MSDYLDRIDRNIRYLDDGDRVTEVFLSVPWGERSGIVPPPSVRFYDHNLGEFRTFIYQDD